MEEVKTKYIPRLNYEKIEDKYKGNIYYKYLAEYFALLHHITTKHSFDTIMKNIKILKEISSFYDYDTEMELYLFFMENRIEDYIYPNVFHEGKDVLQRIVKEFRELVSNHSLKGGLTIFHELIDQITSDNLFLLEIIEEEEDNPTIVDLLSFEEIIDEYLKKFVFHSDPSRLKTSKLLEDIWRVVMFFEGRKEINYSFWKEYLIDTLFANHITEVSDHKKKELIILKNCLRNCIDRIENGSLPYKLFLDLHRRFSLLLNPTFPVTDYLSQKERLKNMDYFLEMYFIQLSVLNDKAFKVSYIYCTFKFYLFHIKNTINGLKNGNEEELKSLKQELMEEVIDMKYYPEYRVIVSNYFRYLESKTLEENCLSLELFFNYIEKEMKKFA